MSLRDSGYLLGDLIEERVDLNLPPGASLDPDSLPLPGRVAPWMEVRASRIEHGELAGAQSVVVRYQIFAEVEQAERVPIPAFKLRVRDGVQTRAVEVPAKSFMLSPALPATLTDEDRELKSAAPPRTLPVRNAVFGVLLSLIGAVACAAYLLWSYDRLPFLPRAPGPFARLWRSWRRRGRHFPMKMAWRCCTLARCPESGRGRDLVSVDVTTPVRQRATPEPLRAASKRCSRVRGRVLRACFESAPAAEELLEVLRHAAERERGVPC